MMKMDHVISKTHTQAGFGFVLVAAFPCLTAVQSTAADGVVPVEIVLATGDVVPGGEIVEMLQPPFTNSLGQVGLTGQFTNGDRFVWIDDQVVWRNSDDNRNTLTGSTSTMGIGDGGEWMYNPSINGNDGIYTHLGPLLMRGDPSPTVRDQYVTFTSRLQMLPDSTMFFISGLNPNQGSTSTLERIMYRVDPSGEFTQVLRAGDEVDDGVIIRTPNGIGFDYQISNGGRHHIHRLQEVGFAPFDFVYVDNTVAAYRGHPADDDTDWNLFRLVSINESGNYVFSGTTSGGPADKQEYLAANGNIKLRSDSVIGGQWVPPGATISALSINDMDQVAFIWRWGTSAEPEGTVFVGSLHSLTTAQPLFSIGDAVDVSGDGNADTLVTNINASAIGGPAMDFSIQPWLYLNVDMEPLGEGDPFSAIVKVWLGCPADCGIIDGVVNVSDLLVLLSQWGSAGSCDINRDGVVNVSDLLFLLSAWGECPR